MMMLIGVFFSLFFWMWCNCTVSMLCICFIKSVICKWSVDFYFSMILFHSNLKISRAWWFINLFAFSFRFAIRNLIVLIIIIIVICVELYSIRFWSFNCLLEYWLFSCFIATIHSSLDWIFIFADYKLYIEPGENAVRWPRTYQKLQISTNAHDKSQTI